MKKITRINISLILSIVFVFLASKAMASTNTYFVSSDNIIDSGKAGEYQKCNTYGDIGSWDSYGGHSFRYLAKINLTGLSSNSQFGQAIFKIDRTSSSWDDDDNYVLYKITSSWSENSVTWNSQPSYSVTGIKAKATGYGMYEFDVTSIVKEWLNNPSSNYGFVIKKEVENTALKSHKGLFACSNYPTSGSEHVPVLELVSGVAAQSSSSAISPVATTTSKTTKISQSSSHSTPALAYKAIVKVKNYDSTDSNYLTNGSYGSGVIISPTGLVLTNNHVVSMKSEYDNSDYKTTYQICLTEDPSLEPNCDYLAKLVAKDSKKDVALLQIFSYPKGKSMIDFNYLNLNSDNSIQINDQITAIGYPSIGGETITVTKGVVSGKTEKYNNQWIKTDAVSSFGSSGGAAINVDGDVVGITTQVYSDSAGSLGYLLNSVSIVDWINQNRNNKPVENSLFSRLADLTNKQHILKTSNKFINLYPYFSFDKPANWTFTHEDENTVSVDNKDDESGGILSVRIIKTPIIQDKNSVKLALLRNFNINGMSSVVKITKESDIKLNNISGKFVTLSVKGKTSNNYLIPHSNYVIWISYDYGEGSKDKAVVNKILSSFKFSNAGPKFVEVHKFTNSTPKFTLSTKSNWPLLSQDNKVYPLEAQSKLIKEAHVNFEISKLDDSQKKMTATELLNQYKSGNDDGNRAIALIDYKYVIEKSGINFKINNKIKAIYYIDGVEKTVSQNKVLAFDRDYFVKSGDSLIKINLTVFSDKRDVFNKAVKEFNSMLQGFSL